MKKHILTLGLATTILSIPAMAEDSIEDALKASDVYLKARYRFEHVDSDAAGITDDANASTLRTVLGAKTGEYEGFSAALEIEDISQIGDDSYNDTLNGRVNRPVVADPEDTAINQFYLNYSGIEDTAIKLGRQVLNLDNQRFIGSVGWRQNDQTLDALNITNSSLEDTKISFTHAQNVNRIQGTDSPIGDRRGNINLLNVSNSSLDIGKITGYYYGLDFDQAAFSANSSNTLGASLNGGFDLDEDFKFKYHLEYATQSDTGDNANDYSADYLRIAPAISYGGLTTTFVYENLGADVAGDAGRVFRTPLATGHKFNGWADVFLNTPAGGLEDLHVDVTYKFQGLEGDYDFLNGLLLKAQYHDFSADKGGDGFGSEIDLYAKLPISSNYYVEAKYASFDADAGSAFSDTDKFILGVGVNFSLTD